MMRNRMRNDKIRRIASWLEIDEEKAENSFDKYFPLLISKKKEEVFSAADELLDDLMKFKNIDVNFKYTSYKAHLGGFWIDKKVYDQFIQKFCVKFNF